MQSHDCELENHSFYDDCSVSVHDTAHPSQVAHHHKPAPHENNQAENDCAIYHALLNLNGVFGGVDSASCVPSHRVTGRPIHHFEIASAVFGEQPIRAPPVFI